MPSSKLWRSIVVLEAPNLAAGSLQLGRVSARTQGRSLIDSSLRLVHATDFALNLESRRAYRRPRSSIDAKPSSAYNKDYV